MSGGPTILTRFMGLPRAVRWLVATALFVIAFLAWDGTAGTLMADWNKATSSLEQKIARIREAPQIELELSHMKPTVVSLGDVEQPGPQNAGQAALHEAVVEVLKGYSVSDDSFDMGGSTEKLPRTLSDAITGNPSKRLKRLTCNVRFVASPEDAIAIIADFEARKEIEAVSSVRITTDDRRQVKVNLTLEAWVEDTEK